MERPPPPRIRDAVAADMDRVAAIYAVYVRETAITFEVEPPSADEFRARHAARDPRHPWLVAEDESGRVIGYASASAFRARPAYSLSAETTVYVERDVHRRGAGRALMMALLRRLRDGGFHAVIAGIALPNPASIMLHEALRFRPVGVFREVGRKFDAWHDVGFWELRFESS